MGPGRTLCGRRSSATPRATRTSMTPRLGMRPRPARPRTAARRRRSMRARPSAWPVATTPVGSPPTDASRAKAQILACTSPRVRATATRTRAGLTKRCSCSSTRISRTSSLQYGTGPQWGWGAGSRCRSMSVPTTRPGAVPLRFSLGRLSYLELSPSLPCGLSCVLSTCVPARH
jgi:hypothetical protein